MPIEIDDKDRFIEISDRAIECRIVKNEEEKIGKVKARTRRYLYTIKVDLDELVEFLKKLKCKKIIEIGPKGEKKEISLQ